MVSKVEKCTLYDTSACTRSRERVLVADAWVCNSGCCFTRTGAISRDTRGTQCVKPPRPYRYDSAQRARVMPAGVCGCRHAGADKADEHFRKAAKGSACANTCAIGAMNPSLLLLGNW